MDHRGQTSDSRNPLVLDPDARGEEPLLSQDRVDQLRGWIARGGHDRPDVHATVANRMLERRDI